VSFAVRPLHIAAFVAIILLRRPRVAAPEAERV
jgi:hypothetical protein